MSTQSTNINNRTNKTRKKPRENRDRQKNEQHTHLFKYPLTAFRLPTTYGATRALSARARTTISGLLSWARM
jgi:hypothetical protein